MRILLILLALTGLPTGGMAASLDKPLQMPKAFLGEWSSMSDDNTMRINPTGIDMGYYFTSPEKERFTEKAEFKILKITKDVEKVFLIARQQCDLSMKKKYPNYACNVDYSYLVLWVYSTTQFGKTREKLQVSAIRSYDLNEEKEWNLPIAAIRENLENAAETSRISSTLSYTRP
jgi:hypothetical protein